MDIAARLSNNKRKSTDMLPSPNFFDEAFEENEREHRLRRIREERKGMRLRFTLEEEQPIEAPQTPPELNFNVPLEDKEDPYIAFAAQEAIKKAYHAKTHTISKFQFITYKEMIGDLKVWRALVAVNPDDHQLEVWQLKLWDEFGLYIHPTRHSKHPNREHYYRQVRETWAKCYINKYN